MRLRAKRALLFAMMAFAVAGCGLLGDGDEAAAPEEQTIEDVVQLVRVEFDDRWFDLNPDDADEALIESTIQNLGADTTAPVNAQIVFEDSAFAVVPSVDGEEPDVQQLLALVGEAAGDATTLAVPFRPIAPEVTDTDAQRFVNQLNGRLLDGLVVSASGRREVLDAEVIGSATTVNRVGDEWVALVNFEQIDEPLQQLFPERSEGGEASFTIIDAQDEDELPTVEVIPGAPSVLCCDERAAEQIEQVLNSSRRPINLLLTTDDGEQGAAWAETLGITEQVASFTTRYTPGQDRNINIQRIAELTQGVIIQPGETFSLNEFVGRRTIDNGFVPAGTIVNGHLVDSVGGGISQYATTLFNSAFFAGLEFEEYQSHSIYFSRYPYGREATISWPAPALKISNPTPYAILVWPTATDRSVTVDLYSTKWVDVEQTGQWERAVGEACTRVFTERTRTFLEEEAEPLVDTVFATYREEGIACDGTETVDPDAPTTTIDPNAPTTTIDPNAPTTTVDPSAPTTTVDPSAPTVETTTTTTTTIEPPASSEPPETSSTTTTTTTVVPEETAEQPAEESELT